MVKGLLTTNSLNACRASITPQTSASVAAVISTLKSPDAYLHILSESFGLYLLGLQ